MAKSNPCQSLTFMHKRIKDLYTVYRNHPEVYWPTVGFLGVQMAWACQISYVSASLMTLGMSDTTVGYAWLAGPLGGIIMQPLAGVYSDHSESRYGRRRPYIVAGIICTLIGLQGFSNAEALGYLFGDSTGHHTMGLIFAIIFFFVMDFSINVAVGPMVALMADTCDVELYPYGLAWFGAHNGIGKTLGYGFGAISLVSTPIFSWLGTNLRALFLLASIFVAGSAALMVVFTPEKQHKRPEGDTCPTLSSAWKEIWQGLTSMPTPICRAFAVQFFTYFSWMCTFIYLATWMGENVYGGSADSTDTTAYDEYEIGIEATCLGYLGMALLSIIWSWLLPLIGRLMGVKLSWALNLVVFAATLFLLATVQEGEHGYAIFLITTLGFPLAATYQIPWTIITVVAQETPEKIALYTTIFNMAQCFPDVLVCLFAGLWISLCGGATDTIFLLGSFAALIAAALCVFVIQPERLYEKTETIPSPSQPRPKQLSDNSNMEVLLHNAF